MDNDLDAWFAADILSHEAALVQYLRRAWPHPDEIHDLRQEVYVRVYEAAGKARPHHSVRAGLAPSAPPQRLSTRRAAGLSTGVNQPEAPPGAGEYT